jgi:signal transduction histidine kinase
MGFVTDQERALADLLVSVMHAREQEGARISRILHDEVGQVLSAAGLQLDLLRMDLDDNVGASPARITEIQKVLEQAVAQVRDLSYELNPSVVERTGLQFALDRLIGRHRKTFVGSIRLLFDPSVRVELERATALFKIAEQALENVVQHSQATQVEVLVKSSKQGATLEVRDNGAGFAAGQPPGLGIQMMRYHAAKTGLRFSIASEPERGTIVKAICRALKPFSGSIAVGTPEGTPG